MKTTKYIEQEKKIAKDILNLMQEYEDSWDDKNKKYKKGPTMSGYIEKYLKQQEQILVIQLIRYFALEWMGDLSAICELIIKDKPCLN